MGEVSEEGTNGLVPIVVEAEATKCGLKSSSLGLGSNTLSHHLDKSSMKFLSIVCIGTS